KIALVLITGIAVHVSLSPPNPPAPPKHILDRRTLFERCIRWVTFTSKTMVWLETLTDAALTLLTLLPALPSYLPAPLPALLRHLAPASPALLRPSPLLAAGALACVLGAALRLACFRALGTLFTFELAIAPGHALVTRGPYACVRHPSYAGVYLTLCGATVAVLARGAWLRECALAPRPAGPGAGTLLAWAALALWTVKVAYALRSTNRRVRTEDGALRAAFGAEWEAYAGRVRWRLVPWVY
ncbi:hypothetical protein WOLCODRAFT_43150, partial [Wolfiporia cocos MD-104 SS10]